MANEVKLKLAIEGGQVVSTTIDGVTTKIGLLDSNARAAASGADTLGTALKGLITIGAAMALVKMADSATQLHNQLRLSSNSASEASKAYGALFDIAQKSRVSFTELGITYAAIARSGRELGISQTRLLDVTKSISQAMTIGGGSAASMQAALVQLGQGLSSGTLRGEELNSIMEQTPRLAKAIADGLGVPIGELRKLGETGQLTSQQVIAALEKAGPALAKEMESATLTVGQAFTNLTNSAVKFVGDADTATGASTTLATAMKSASEAMDTVGAAIKNNEAAFNIVTYGLAGSATVAGITALAGVVSTRLIPSLAALAVAAGPLAWITLTIGAIGGAAVAAGKAWANSAQGMGNSATRLKNEIEAIDKAISSGLNQQGDKVTEIQKQQLSVTRQMLVEKKKLIDQEIALKAAGNAESPAETARLEAGTAAYKAREQALKAFNDAGGKYLSKAAKDQATLNTEIEIAQTAFATGGLSATQYAERINAVQASFTKATPHVKTGSEAVREAAKGMALYNDLLAKNDGFTAGFAEQVISLTKARLSADEYSTAVALLLAQQPQYLDAAKAEADATKATDKARLDAITTQDKATQSAQDALAKQLEHNATIGLSTTALAQLEAANLSLQATELERKASLQDGVMWDATVADGYLKEAKALRELAAAKVAGAGKQAGVTAADELAKANKSAAEASGKYWEDALMRAFESGKGFFQSLWDTIKNTLKTQVLKVMVSATGVTGMTAAGAASASGASGGFTDALSAYNTFTSGFSSSLAAMKDVGGTIAHQTGLAASSLINNGFETAGKAMADGAKWLADSAQTINQASDILGYATAAYSLSQGKVATAAGQAIGTYFGGAIGSYIGGKIGGAVDKFFGGETRSGAVYDTGADGKARYQQGPSGGEIAGDQARKMFDATQSTIKNTLLAFGSKATLTGYTAGLESSGNGKGFEFAGGYINGKAFGEAGGRNSPGPYHSQDSQQAFTDYGVQLSQSIIEALQATPDIPKTITDIINQTLDGAAVSSLSTEATTKLLDTLNAVAGTVNAFNAAVKDLPFEALKNMSFDAAAGLIAAAGGLEKLGSNLSGFYDNFYTSDVKTANLTSQTTKAFEALGIAMPAVDGSTRDWYRGIVEAQLALDQSIPGNAAVTASVLSLQTAVNTLAPAFTDAAKAADAAQQSLTTAMQGIADATKALLDISRSSLEAAASNLQAAYSAESATLTATKDRFAGIATQFRGFADGLASALETPQNSFEWLSAEYTRLSGLARLGDADAASRATNIGTQLQSAIIAKSANSAEASLAIARLRVSALTTESQALTQSDTAQQSLDALTTQVSQFVALNDSVLSVKNAIDAFKIAQADFDKVQNQYLQNIALGIASAYAAGNTQGALTGVGNLVGTQGMTTSQISTALSGAMSSTQIEALTKIADVNVNGVITAAEVATASAVQNVAQSMVDIVRNEAGTGSVLDQVVVSGTNNAATATTAAGQSAAAIYQQLLGRPIDQVGLNLAQSGAMSIEQITAMVKSSQEFSVRNSLGVDAQNLLIQQVNAGLGIATNIKAFATGGYHTGGMRLVGEHGPELEVTGPSRIYNAADTMAMLRNPQANNEALVAEIRALRQEVADLRRANSTENAAIATHAAFTADSTRRMDTQGVMVYTDPAEPISTKAAA